MEEKKESFADLKSKFEKSPTNVVAEAKAKFEKHTGPAPTAVPRSNSFNKLISPSSSGDEALKTLPKAAPNLTLESPRSQADVVKQIKSPKNAKTETPVSIQQTTPEEKVAETVQKGSPEREVEVVQEEVANVGLATPSLLVSTASDESPPEPLKVASPTASKFLAAAGDFSIPPTVQEQDYYVLWGLSFVVPFFLLRLVFELVRKCILGPTRMVVRHAPGGSKLLSYLYVKAAPALVLMTAHLKARLPPMDAINMTAKAGLERFLSTLQTAAAGAWPHVLDAAESIKNLKFREAFAQVTAVMMAWAPMLLLLIPLTKNILVGLRQGWIMFWRVSKTAVYLPFGSFLRRAVQRFGQTLSENPDVFAERVAGLLGPIVGFFFSFIVVFGLGLQLGLVNYHTLSSMYLAWFFRLLGLVSEPSLLDQGSLRLDESANLMANAFSEPAAAVVTESGNTGGFVW